MKIAIIPARANSKGVVNKNLQRVGPKSLITHAIDFAKQCRSFDRICISTDIETVINDIKETKSIYLRQRPEGLATDGASMLDVVLDVLNFYKITTGEFWLLQPTAPFRIRSDIAEIESIQQRLDPKSIISVTDIEAMHPMRMYTERRGLLFPIKKTNFDNRQKLPRIYIRNGAFYVCNIESFLKQKTFWVHPCAPYLMEKDRSINIDNEEDLQKAKSYYATFHSTYL